VRPWQHVLEPLAGYLRLGQQLLTDARGAAGAWNFGPPAAAHQPVGRVIEAFAAAWPAVRYELDDRAHPHEARSLHLDCSKAAQGLGWTAVWDLPTTLQRSARWYRQQHEQGAVCSRGDLHQYVADARQRALAWAA
jgi:CDP-glucose 4,6-dehydratase